jgi:hypothetical protein
MTTLNQITIVNNSGLDSTKYIVWVAGFMASAAGGGQFQILQADGSFAAAAPASNAPFVDVNSGLTIQVPSVTNSGNNRLVFTVTPKGTTPAAYPLNGYTAYPFPGVPGVAPAGPYDIFEFGPNAQYDVSAVDSFGINLSFTVAGDPLTYGVMPSVTRAQIATAFTAFMKADPCGTAFSQLLYTSPASTGYPPLIDGQFSAIVSPKDWLAIYPTAAGLKGYWHETVEAFFTSGNQISFYLNGATVGTYSGSSDGTQYTLSGPNGMTVVIPKSDFAGNQPFIQAVPGPNQSPSVYAAYGQIEAAIFQAFSRGVVLDGVMPAGKTISAAYSSDAWSNTANWYSNHKNAYNNKPSVYDAYAKFFHTSTADGTAGSPTIFGMNSSGNFGMAYGFSLDENPNIGSTSQNIPPGAWPSGLNVPAKTSYDVGSQAVTLTVGPWS